MPPENGRQTDRQPPQSWAFFPNTNLRFSFLISRGHATATGHADGRRNSSSSLFLSLSINGLRKQDLFFSEWSAAIYKGIGGSRCLLTFEFFWCWEEKVKSYIYSLDLEEGRERERSYRLTGTLLPFPICHILQKLIKKLCGGGMVLSPVLCL